jgi:hypothetical protein
MRIGYVEFEDVRNARDVYDFFNSGSRIPINEHNQTITVSWCYNRLYTEPWITIVLRNIPTNDTKAIHKTCTRKGERVRYITQPILIKEQWCCMVIVEDIEDAERICLRVNNTTVDKKGKVRAHIHPSSTMNRKNKEKSHNTLFAHMKEYLPETYKTLALKKSIRKVELPENKYKRIRDTALTDSVNEVSKHKPSSILLTKDSERRKATLI